MYLRLDESVQGPPTIELVGEEFTCIQFRTNLSPEGEDTSQKKANVPSGNSTDCTAHNVRQVCRIVHTLGKKSSIIGSGRFEFPFCILLPDTLPSSFKMGSKDYCGVRYYLRASIACYTAPRVYFQLIKSSDSLSMQSKVYVEPVQIPVSSCCIRNRGLFTITGTINKSLFHAGDSAVVEVGLSNNTDVDLNSMLVTITQHVLFAAGDKSQEFYNIIDRKTIDLSKTKLGKKHEYRKMADLAKMNSNSVIEIQTNVIPLFALPTYFGVLIKIRYAINLIGGMSSKFTSSPSIAIPINVQSQKTAKRLDIVPYTTSPLTEDNYHGICLTEYHGLVVDENGIEPATLLPAIKAVPVPTDWSGKSVSFNVLNEYNNEFEFGSVIKPVEYAVNNSGSSQLFFTVENDSPVQPPIIPRFSSIEILFSTLKYSFDQILVIKHFIALAARYTEGEINYESRI